MNSQVDLGKKISWAIAVKQHGDFYTSRDHTRFLLQGSRAVKYPKVVNFLNNVFDQSLYQQLGDVNNLREFVHNFPEWINNHAGNKLHGLDKFQIDFSAGTTQSFDSFYFRHKNRRMRCLVGEYFYHLKTWISTNTLWSFVTDEDPITGNDALVISLPFCDTGNQRSDFEDILERCNQLNVPVLVDCCYFPISFGINADLNHPCVDTVTFSLSKAFPVANLRIGVRFTKPGIFDGQSLYNSIGYTNCLSAFVGNKLINQFSSNYIFDTYQEKQTQVCNFLNLTPSQSVLFATGDETWSYFSRRNLLDVYQLDFDANNFCNRISLVAIYDDWDIFERIKNEHTTQI